MGEYSKNLLKLNIWIIKTLIKFLNIKKYYQLFNKYFKIIFRIKIKNIQFSILQNSVKMKLIELKINKV